MPKRRVATLNYQPLSQKHHAFHASEETRTFIIGGVGSGKTFACVAEILSQLLENPEGRGKTALVVGRTATHCRQQLLPLFRAVLTNYKNKRNVGFREGQDYKVTLANPIVIDLPFGSKVLFWSIEGGSSIKGLNVTHAFVDEVTDAPEQVYDDLFDRIGREGDTPGRLWAAGNPSHQGNWVYRRYFAAYDNNGEQNIPGSGVSCHYIGTFDNPLTESKREAYEQQYAYSSLERRRKIEGHFCNMEGLVFPSFDPERHTFTLANDGQTKAHLNVYAINNEWEHFAGVDFGERDPTAILCMARDPEGCFYVYAEYRQSGGTIPEHAAWLKRQQARRPITRIFSDIYSETVTSYRLAGVNLTPYKKTPGSVLIGIAVINQLMADNKLKISRDCKELIREVESYEWKTGGKEEPRAGYGDHCIDALRYAVMSLQAKTEFRVLSNRTPIASKGPEDTRTIFAYERDGTPIYMNAPKR